MPLSAVNNSILKDDLGTSSQSERSPAGLAYYDYIDHRNWKCSEDHDDERFFVDISEDRGTKLTIDIPKMEANYKAVREQTGNKEVIAVVKARAYGAGLVPVSLALAAKGCRAFAVATLGAALSLRRAFSLRTDLGFNTPRILVLGYTPPDGLAKALQHDISLTLVDDAIWELYVKEAEAKELHSSVKKNKVAFHINIDTGMRRVGITSDDKERCLEAFKKVDNTSWSYVEGVYTHMSRSNTDRSTNKDDEQWTITQMESFESVVEFVAEKHKVPSMVHVSNSPSICQYPETYKYGRITHVRPGSLLHGICLKTHVEHYQRVMKWQTTLVRVEKLSHTTTVGYGSEYQAQAGTTIGTLAVGFADGYLPSLSQRERISSGGTGTQLSNQDPSQQQLQVPDDHNRVSIDGVLIPVVSLGMDMAMVVLDKYIKEKGKAPDPSTAIVTLLNDHLPSDDKLGCLSVEAVAKRWGVPWPVPLTNIRTRNTRIYVPNREHAAIASYCSDNQKDQHVSRIPSRL